MRALVPVRVPWTQRAQKRKNVVCVGCEAAFLDSFWLPKTHLEHGLLNKSTRILPQHFRFLNKFDELMIAWLPTHLGGALWGSFGHVHVPLGGPRELGMGFLGDFLGTLGRPTTINRFDKPPPRSVGVRPGTTLGTFSATPVPFLGSPWWPLGRLLGFLRGLLGMGPLGFCHCH